jgi:hypothetical membrane protein
MTLDRRTRLLLVGGAVGPLLFMATFFIESATRPGYRPWRNMVSQLATGEGGWVQIVNFVLCGVLVVAGAVGLWRAGASRAVSRLIGTLGLGLMIAGVFVADPGLGYPPGVLPESDPTPHALVHGLVSLVSFLALGAAPLVIGWSERRSSPAWSAYSALSGIVTLAFFAATIYGSMAGDSTTPIGVLQRISIVAGFGWLSVLCLRILIRGQGCRSSLKTDLKDPHIPLQNVEFALTISELRRKVGSWRIRSSAAVPSAASLCASCASNARPVAPA